MSSAFPVRQPSSHRRVPNEQPHQPSSSASAARAASVPRSDDSEPVVLQKPQDSTPISQGSEEPLALPSRSGSVSVDQHSSAAAHSQVAGQAEEDDIKKCWICFADATEDTPETSPWRDPCPCALIAHEECLLDWIADIEAPNRSRNRRDGGHIECPQCKGEIKLSRPRSVVVDAVRGMERLAGSLVTPGAVTVLFGSLYQSSVAWGIHSIYAVFGGEDGFRLLEPLLINRVRPPINLDGVTPRELGQLAINNILDHLVHWRLYVGLPLITPILILSRTGFADTLLPTLPIAFFATQAHMSRDMLQIGKWPPSAPFAFAMLPYVRAIYNWYYAICWQGHEQRWLREIQPRAGQDQENGDAELANQRNGDFVVEDENVFEIRVDGGIWDEWDNEDDIIAEAERIAAQGNEQNDNDDDQVEAQEENGENAPVEVDADGVPAQQQGGVVLPEVNNAAAAGGNGERRLSFSPTAIAETVLGALVFPSIAGFSGDLLKLVLPRSWTTPPSSAFMRKGLLQEKWGRTILGGCLFVVLKDAVMLYVRWKMARMHRQRKVLDYDRTQGMRKQKAQ